jgi:hypothetical protein
MGDSILEHPCINIIFDDRQNDDYERLLGEFIKQTVPPKYKFWPCVINNKSVVSSINASHKMIVQWAKENGLKEVCVAEQDLEFTHSTAWEYFLNNKPKEYDLYLGGSYVKDRDEKTGVFKFMICGFHLYIINEKYYDAFLSVKDTEHIDTEVGDLKGNFVFCYPFPAIQRPGYSANSQEVVNYNTLLQPEDIYIGQCSHS